MGLVPNSNVCDKTNSDVVAEFRIGLHKETAVPVGNLIWLAVDRESGDAVVQ